MARRIARFLLLISGLFAAISLTNCGGTVLSDDEAARATQFADVVARLSQTPTPRSQAAATPTATMDSAPAPTMTTESTSEPSPTTATLPEAEPTGTPTVPDEPEVTPTTEPTGTTEAAPTVEPTLEPTGPPEATPTSEPTSTTEAVPDASPTVPPALADTVPADPVVIRLAVQSPLTAGSIAEGTGIRNSVNLAIQQKAGPLSPRFRVELVAKDDKGNAAQGQANALELEADPNVVCLVGHYNSGVALASLPIYQRAGLVMISPANTSPEITESGYSVAWRVVGRDDVQGKVAADYIRDKLPAAKRIYVVHNGDPVYGRAVAENFRDSAQSNGLTILNFVELAPQQQQTLIDDIASQQPDLIYFGGLSTEAGPFFQAVANTPTINATFMGPDGLDSPNLVENHPFLAARTIYTTAAAPVGRWGPANTFASDYQRTFGSAAPPYSVESYDAASICIQAIIDATNRTGGKPTRAAVVQAMNNLSRVPGIAGPYDFNREGDPRTAVYFILRVTATRPEDWNANPLIAEVRAGPP